METIPLAPTGRKAKLNCCPTQENDGLRVIIFCFGVLCICVTIALVISVYLGEPEVLPNGAVATDSQQCSQIGVNFLKKGGSAVDAVVASVFCLLVSHPHIVSLGGGGAMIVLDHLNSKTPVVINFQNPAPSFVSASWLGDTVTGPGTVGIPGILSGLWLSHKQYGKLDWASLIQPAIELSNNGVSVSPQLAAATLNLPDSSPLRRSKLFFPKGIPLAEGQDIKQPKLGQLLNSIAQNGPSAFYNGTFGQKLVDFMKKYGSEWTLEDLQKYQATTEPAISTTYDKWTVYTSSAPTTGPQLLSLLNILSGFSLTTSDRLSLHYNHQLIETMRLTQNQIIGLGDQLFEPRVKTVVSDMINKTLADRVREQILPNISLPDSSVPSLPDMTASVVSVMDNQEIYATFVGGLNSMFGSHVLTPDGYLLNNALANFFPRNDSLPNSGAQPGQRPLQSFLPVIATESKSRCGVRFTAGGSDAPLLGQVVMNLLQFNQSSTNAILSPRLFAEAQSHQLSLEDIPLAKLPDTLIDALKAMGHSIKLRRPPYPSVNIATRIGDSVVSYSDSRGGGYAVKYGP